MAQSPSNAPPPSGRSAQPAAANPTRRTVLRTIGGLVAAGSIGTAVYGSVASGSSGDDLRASATIIAPAAAGGGWDAVARALQQAQRANGIINNAQVVNMPGAGGTIALGNVGRLTGNAHTLLVGGTGLLAATVQYDSPVAFTDITPLATIVEEYDVIAVPADSPHTTLDELIAAWQKAPRSVPFSGGGSFDQLVVTDLALKNGIAGADINYISSDGGGEVIQALLNGTVQAAANGLPDTLDQIEAGRVRALALVSEKPVSGIDIPTTVELGHDVTLTNWRSISAPAGITAEQKAELTAIIQETLHTPEWLDAEKTYAWAPARRYGAELDEFLAQQTTRINELYQEMA